MTGLGRPIGRAVLIALLGDGAWDALSWATLGATLGVIAWFWLRPRMR